MNTSKKMTSHKVSMRTREGWHEQANKSRTCCDIDGLQLYKNDMGLYCDKEHEPKELTYRHFTLEQIKSRNTDFFSTDKTRYHGDKSHTLEVNEHGQQVLKINTTHGVVYYKVDNNGHLTFTNL